MKKNEFWIHIFFSFLPIYEHSIGINSMNKERRIFGESSRVPPFLQFYIRRNFKRDYLHFSRTVM